MKTPEANYPVVISRVQREQCIFWLCAPPSPELPALKPEADSVEIIRRLVEREELTPNFEGGSVWMIYVSTIASLDALRAVDDGDLVRFIEEVTPIAISWGRWQEERCKLLRAYIEKHRIEFAKRRLEYEIACCDYIIVKENARALALKERLEAMER